MTSFQYKRNGLLRASAITFLPISLPPHNRRIEMGNLICYCYCYYSICQNLNDTFARTLSNLCMWVATIKAISLPLFSRCLGIPWLWPCFLSKSIVIFDRLISWADYLSYLLQFSSLDGGIIKTNYDEHQYWIVLLGRFRLHASLKPCKRAQKVDWNAPFYTEQYLYEVLFIWGRTLAKARSPRIHFRVQGKLGYTQDISKKYYVQNPNVLRLTGGIYIRGV